MTIFDTTAISIVIPCYNRAHDLLRVLTAYEHQVDQPGFEVIAVDDNSNDHTYQLLTDYQPQNFVLRVVRQAQNQGPAAARNRGIKLAQSPIIVFAGDDILPAPDFVSSHLAAHQQYPQPEVAVLGKVVWSEDMPVNTLMRHIDGPGAQQFSYYYFQNGQEYDFRQFYTANISVKTALLQRVDRLFDTSFPYAAFEDAELAYRLSRHGLRIIYDARPVGYHYHYHTVWTFAKRQYRAGLMACKAAEKHPELADFLRVTKTRFLFLLGLAHQFTRPKSLENTAIWLEQEVLYLTSFYEWMPHPLLDDLYLNVLEYFWRKGLIDGVFKDSPRQATIRNAYAIYYLGDLLESFLTNATNHNISCPIQNNRQLHLKLTAVKNPVVKRILNWWQNTGYRLAKSKLYPETVPSS